ncbi:condensation domain-containing protein [Plantactinospora sp. ZYX-F-223]|uniref:condensation domain-containing protein n=1 Tax=Plantactinospora sp. ZYX-F-223 TaxID=3144103 RepID=UPI0031FD1FF9
MRRLPSVRLSFSGLAADVEEATWAQHFQVVKTLNRRSGDYNSNIAFVFPVTRDLEAREAAAVFLDLLVRHESLRTRFRRGPSGDIQQSVAGDGTLEFEVIECRSAEESETEAHLEMNRLTAIDFDIGTDLGLRASIITLRNTVSHIAVCASHAAADAWAVEMLKDELQELLSDDDGSGDRPSGVQSLDTTPLRPIALARGEQSADGQRTEAASLAYVEDVLRKSPQSMFATFAGVGTADATRGKLYSTAARTAAESIAARLRVSTTMVYYAAICALLSWLNSTPRCYLSLAFANRSTPEERVYIGPMVADADIVVDAVSGTFEDLIYRVRLEAMMAYSNCRYDVAKYVSLADKVGRERGMAFDRWLLVNDLQLLDRSDPAGRSEHAPTVDRPATRFEVVQPRALRALRSRDNEPPTPVRFHLAIATKDEYVIFDMQCSTAILSNDNVRAFLYGIEQIVRQSVDAPTPLTSLGDVVDLRRYERGDDWVFVDHSWVHLPSVANMLRTLAVGDGSGVSVREGQDGQPVIAAEIGSGDGRLFDVAEVHARVSEVLHRFGPVIAPHEYLVEGVVHAAARTGIR